MKYKKHGITLPIFLSEYIKEDNINLSHFVQDKLKERMQSQGKLIPKEE